MPAAEGAKIKDSKTLKQSGKDQGSSVMAASEAFKPPPRSRQLSTASTEQC